ncbi:MAG: ATP synthase F1 subunit epsilon [Balneolaceae bacterium]
MANIFHAQLLTPNGPLFEGNVTAVHVPGIEGNFEILFNHAPIVSTLDIGKILIKKEDAKELAYAVSGGFVEMSNNTLTILAEKAEESSGIDMDEARKARDEAKNRLKEKPLDRKEAERDLAVAENRLKIAE